MNETPPHCPRDVPKCSICGKAHHPYLSFMPSYVTSFAWICDACNAATKKSRELRENLMTSDTPRTDEAVKILFRQILKMGLATHFPSTVNIVDHEWVDANFARALERERQDVERAHAETRRKLAVLVDAIRDECNIPEGIRQAVKSIEADG